MRQSRLTRQSGGNLATRTSDGNDATTGKRRARSTRRRQDAPDLPRRRVSDRTTGRVYTTPDGKAYRPSMFLTLTLDSYGNVGADEAAGGYVDRATGELLPTWDQALDAIGRLQESTR
jgi:hypothetical protein